MQMPGSAARLPLFQFQCSEKSAEAGRPTSTPSASVGGLYGIMEKNMETTIVYWGYIGNSGKEHENYYNGLYTLPQTN